MTKFSLSDISHLATLSGLTLTDSEAEQLRSSLDSVIGYVGMLDELDVEGVEPVYQVTDLYNVHEDDEIIDAEPIPQETPRERRKRHRKEFWDGAAEVMMVDLFIDEFFKKKK